MAETRGVIVTYDIPVKKVVDGHGVVDTKPLYIIRKLERSGLVERLQNSVLLVKTGRALDIILTALRASGARILVIKGTYSIEG